MKTRMPMGLYLLLAILVCSSCLEGDDDDAAAGGGETADDDAADQPADDDTNADDDGAVGNIAADIEATVERPVDPAVIWDDEGFPVCEDITAIGDDCANAMWRIYCLQRLPVIFEGHWYTQSEAVEACREGASPVWADLVECAGDVLAYCLSERGWPPGQTDIFDASQWRIEGVADREYAQALNFFYFNTDNGWTYRLYQGGVVYPSQPMLRVNAYVHSNGVLIITDAHLTGDNTFYGSRHIDFWLFGGYLCSGEACGSDTWLPTWMTLTFRPIAQEDER